MTPNALFISWDRAVAGREGQAGELFQQMLGFFGKQQAAGNIESFEPVILTLHGGSTNGFVVVRGTTEKLNTLRDDEGFVGLIMQCGHAIEKFSMIQAYQGQALEQIMGKWMQQVAAG